MSAVRRDIHAVSATIGHALAALRDALSQVTHFGRSADPTTSTTVKSILQGAYTLPVAQRRPNGATRHTLTFGTRLAGRAHLAAPAAVFDLKVSSDAGSVAVCATHLAAGGAQAFGAHLASSTHLATGAAMAVVVERRGLTAVAGVPVAVGQRA